MSWIAEIAAWGILGYLALGLGFAVPFVTRGIERVDLRARGTGPGFRLIVLPGAVALWPWLLARWLRSRQ